MVIIVGSCLWLEQGDGHVDMALQEGLDILIQDKNVLSCWSDRWDAIWYAELGSSWAVLNAGFNIDCMISRSATQRLPPPQ